MSDTKGVRQVLAETIQVRRVGRATDPKPKDQVWFTTQMQDLFVLDFDALEVTLQEIMLGMLPEKCLGKELNLSVQATSFLTADPHQTKKIQGEGFDMAIKLMEQNIRGGFNNG